MMSSTIAQPVREDIQPYDTVQISHRRVASSGASSELVATLDEFENQSGDEEFEHTVQDEDDVDDVASVQSLDSLLDGVIEIAELTDEALATYKGEPEVCTLEEATAFRAQLRAIGPEAFCKETIYSGKITARKLITAFGLQPPQFHQNETDDAFYRLLGLAISRELSKRIKLQQYNTLDDAVELIKKSKNIVVLTGAGISTSLGIPDFRSKGTGIYSRLKDVMTEYGLTDPQEVFDIRLFREHPEVFFRVAAEILVTIDKCSPTHTFIAMLQNQGKLLTNYSQNIDNIEAIAGILPEKIVQCHGSFATASCTTCKYQVDGTDVVKTIKAGVIPRCDQCKNRLRPATMKRKRSANGRDKKRARNGWGGSDSSEEDYDDPEPKGGEGIMKPDITFFGEPLPDTFSKRLTTHDKFLVDLVIVIGTSLKVAPVSEVVPYLPAHVPQMYISRDPVSHVNFDIDLLGDCDIVVAELCRRAGWDLKHEMAVPKDQEIEVNSIGSRHYFKIKKAEKAEESKE